MMQALPKKAGFKCPKFSVPAKPQSEKTNPDDNKEKQLLFHHPEKVNKQAKKPLHDEVTADGDSKVTTSKQVPETDPCGDNKAENAEIKGTHVKPEYKPESGDSGNTSLSKEDKTDTQVESNCVKEKHCSSAVKEKKVAKKKNKTEFRVKAASVDNQNDEETKKEKKKKENKSDVKKPKKDKQKKDPKERKDSKIKEPKTTLPVMSFTEREYTAIFDATIENAMNLNIDEWAPKTTSPLKKKGPVKKKYSLTVGKKFKETAVSSQENTVMMDNNEGDDDEHEVLIGLDSSEIGDNIAENAQERKEETEKQEEVRDNMQKDADKVEEVDMDQKKEIVDEEKDNNILASENGEDVYSEHEEEEHADKREQVDVNNNNLEENEERYNAAEVEIVVDDNEVDEEPFQDRAQEDNETTPVGSEVDSGERHAKCIVPPVKKKKMSKVIKNPKLEPKQLPFERTKEASMVEKVKQIKKQKLKRLNSSSKKKKLYDGVKEHGVEKSERKSSTLLQEDMKRKKHLDNKISKKQKMLERELEINGTWVQCCNSTCMKWRYLSDVSDPTLVPERWTCSMNTNKNYNSCEKAEEKYDESEHIYTKFAEGSVVWARMTGYPWWPAMVEIDPDTETFFSVDSEDSMIPTHYHVVFLDEHVSRTWVKSDHLKMLTGNEDDDGILYQIPKKGQSYKKEIAIAKKNAIRARSCTIQERIELFGFAARYKGPWSSKSKGNKADKHRNSKVTSGQNTKADKVNFLDEDTMDDVLENTDALLDNVEEMLESINSQLDDSDADSDFMPEELIVVETKKKARKSSFSSPKRTEKNSKKVNFTETNVEVNVGNDKNSTKNDETTSKMEENSTNKAIEDGTKSETVNISLKLDSDIFTMEMCIQNDKTSVEGEEESKEKGNEKSQEKFHDSALKMKGKSNKRKNKTSPDYDQNEMNAKKQKENESEKNVMLLTKDESKDKLDNQTKSKKQNEMLENVPEVENKEIPKDCNTTKSIKTKLGTDIEGNKNEINTDVKKKKKEISGEKEQDSKREGHTDVENKKTDDDIVKSENERTDYEKEVQKQVEVDDNSDLHAIESDALPDLDREEINGNNTRSFDQSLDESDSDFDLEEHYMYETVTDGSDKVRERGVVNVPAHVTEVEEDSDPFDLMEE